MFQTFGHSVFSLCSWKQASTCGTEHCPRVPILLPHAFCGNEWLLVSTAHCPGSHVRGTSGAPSGESQAAHRPPPHLQLAGQAAAASAFEIPPRLSGGRQSPPDYFSKPWVSASLTCSINSNAIKDAPGNLVTVFNFSLLPS